MGKQGECLKTKVLKSDVGCPKQEAQNLKQLTNTRITP